MADKNINVKITADTNDATSKMQKFRRQLKDTGKEAADAVSNIDKSLQNIASAAIGTAIGSVVVKIGELGVASIKAASQMRQYEIAFSTMLKSASKGKAMLQSLQRFAAQTPFDVPGVVTAAQQLMAFGFQAEEIIPILTSLGDAAAGLGKGTAGVQQLAYALGQMKTSGTLKTQDVNQLTNAGIDAWRILADATGKTITEIKDLTEKGMIDSVKAVDVLVAGINTRFGGMMAKTSTEVAGLVSNVQESLGTAQATIGAFLTDSLRIKDVLKSVSDAIGSVSSTLQKARDEGKSFSAALQEAFSPEAIKIMGALAAVVGVTLVGALGAAVAALGAFAGVTAPVVAACAAIGYKLTDLALNWDNLSMKINKAYNALVEYVDLAKKRYFGEFGYSEYDNEENDRYNTGVGVPTNRENQATTTAQETNTAVTMPSIADIFTTGQAATESVKNQKPVLDQVADAWQGYANSVAGGFGSAVDDMLTGSKTFGQAMADMLRNIVRNVAQTAAQFLMLTGILSAFGVANAGNVAVRMMFGIDAGSMGNSGLQSHNMSSYKNSYKPNGITYATGGYVAGPGTSTSDSIPTMLSNGEYVVNAAAVRQIGLPALNAINSGRGFADGGLVGAVPIATNAGPASNNTVTLHVSALDASSFESFLQGGGLDKIKQALFDDNRNFASAAGVW